MKYASKGDLLERIHGEHGSLRASLEAVPDGRRDEAGVWGDDWTVTDLVAHLAAWHRLLLGWFREGERGGIPEMPASGYKWNETPRLNRAIRERNAGRPYAEVLAEFEDSHAEVVRLVERLSEAELLEPGHFPWARTNALATYVGANTDSHYRFATKVLRRWRRRGESGR